MNSGSSGQIKTFVIDTNVFIHKPDAIMSFRDNEVVVPLQVLEELDRLKTYSDEKGRNARHAIRLLDSIGGKHGAFNEGVKMENGSILRVELEYEKDVPIDIDLEKPDNKIILTAYLLQKRGKRVFFVSQDINARVKATAMGIKAVDYEKQKINISLLYPGYLEAQGSAETMQKFRIDGSTPWPDQLVPNQFVLFRDRNEPEDFAIGRYKAQEGALEYVESVMGSVCGIKPLNPEQRMAFDLLLDENVNLVTLVGKAGTGKTLLAIAAGLKMVIEEKAYSRVLVTRPVVPLGKDIGYLPGSKNEKLSHWMQPLFDNLEYILTGYRKSNVKSAEGILNSKMIELEALTYIRGRSLPGQYIIIDEAQNLSPHEIKTIVSRAGEGTKVVLTGDPYQIDSPYLDASSNGLTFLVEAFKGQPLFGHVILSKSERSPLAELAAELL